VLERYWHGPVAPRLESPDGVELAPKRHQQTKEHASKNEPNQAVASMLSCPVCHSYYPMPPVNPGASIGDSPDQAHGACHPDAGSTAVAGPALPLVLLARNEGEGGPEHPSRTVRTVSLR
jgi:hypothetical protein